MNTLSQKAFLVCPESLRRGQKADDLAIGTNRLSVPLALPFRSCWLFAEKSTWLSKPTTASTFLSWTGGKLWLLWRIILVQFWIVMTLYTKNKHQQRDKRIAYWWLHVFFYIVLVLNWEAWESVNSLCSVVYLTKATNSQNDLCPYGLGQHLFN